VQPYPISQAQRDDYRNNGFIRLPQLFRRTDIAAFEQDISKAVARLHDPMAFKPPNSDSSAYTNAFTQVMNLWRHDEQVRAIVFNQRLAAAAAQLLGVASVRLYHDQALYKAPHGGMTPWHCDQYYWPLDSDKTITAWIPLQDTPLEMGALAFSAGSHLIDLGRDLPIGEDSEQLIEAALQAMQLPQIESVLEVGDVSFHSGWTFHRAGGN
jgi:ectoine hydroxylase-related dioxygenase (phytanoyl-CoA dioxygenase family)